jgi:hypothetical protein
LQKLADNGVDPEAVERIIRQLRHLETSNSSGLPACRGRINSRVLFCVFEFIDELTIRPVTAYWIHED